VIQYDLFALISALIPEKHIDVFTHLWLEVSLERDWLIRRIRPLRCG